MVVAEARRIIFMTNNVSEDEMPPKSLWHSPRKCVEWIKARRDEKYPKDGRKSSGGFLEFKENEVETSK